MNSIIKAVNTSNWSGHPQPSKSVERTATFNFDNHLVWLLDDGLDGHRNQSLGLLDALGIRHHWTVNIEPRSWGNLLGHFKRTWRWRIPPPPYPDLIVGAGKAAGLVLPVIKRRCPAVFTVQLMRPHRPSWHYDVVIQGAHTETGTAPNVLTTTAALHRCTSARLAEASVTWALRFGHLPRPFTALLLGGTMHGFPSVRRWGPPLIDDVLAYAQHKDGSLLVTTSRRTPVDLTRGLQTALEDHGVPFFLFDAQQHNAPNENPYMALLGLADDIVVTADSLSMISEACGTDRPVYIWGKNFLRRPKYRRFHDNLQAIHRITDLADAGSEALTTMPLNDSARAAAFVRERFAEREHRYAAWPAAFLSPSNTQLG